MGVKVTKDSVADVLKSIHKLVSKEVLIGIPQQNDQRKEGPLNNATIGYIQETGSPSNNLPARPFLVPGVQSIVKPATERMRKGAEKALDGDAAAAEKSMMVAGMMGQNSVRGLINSGISPPLAESTLEARRRRGRTGEVPLIDTGQLRNSITYVIRPKG